MSLMSCASYKSLWRGYEYFKQDKVLEWMQESESEFYGLVGGSNGTYYNVYIDLDHPRKSTCNCPHADGRRVICKHMVALFFKAFPEEAEKYYNDVANYEAEERKRQEKIEKKQAELEIKVIDHVCKMKKNDLAEALLQILFDGPEWQYEKFIREYIEW